MARLKEKLTGGLVTRRDPALLEPGQLSAGKNAVLRAGTDALHRASGRTVFGTVSATAVGVVGIRDIKFDNSLHLLVAHASASYLTATAGDVGTFGVLASGIGVGSQLEVVHYRNRFFLFNGVAGAASAIGTNRVAYLTATAVANTPTTRQHGMLPVMGNLNPTTATGVFSLADDGVGAIGYYEYWSTEVAEITQDGAKFKMESAFDGKPDTVSILTTAVVPTLTFPPTVNAISTHYRLYRSIRKDRAADMVFPAGFMIAEVGIPTSVTDAATVQVADTQTVSTTGIKLPASFNTTGFYSDATNPTNALTDNGAFAELQTGAMTVNPLTDQGTRKQAWYGYDFGGFRGPIKGIEVFIEAFCDTQPVQMSVSIGPNRRSEDGDFGRLGDGRFVLREGRIIWPQKVATKSQIITATAASTTYTFGSDTDAWLSGANQFVDSEFDGNFMVMVTVRGATRKVSIDFVEVKVHYGATSDPVIPFPTVVYEFSGESAQVAKNGPPPSSSTGDLYQDTLVVNDVSNPGLIRYSYPGDPEAFPGTYYVDYETRENDRVTLIKTVNDKLVVALDTSIWRQNYLPSERDASFDRGKSKEPISEAFGCVNPMCACTFSPAGSPQLLAFVSHKGIFATNGHSLKELTEDLDWRGIIPTTATATPICLIDDPENRCLRFLYRNDANTPETFLELRISYDGRISGPTHMRNWTSGSIYASLESAWSIRRSNGDTSIYYGYGGTATAAGAGKVYVEGGTTIPSNDSTWGWSTRRMFLAGDGEEFTANETYFYTSDYDGAPVFTVTPNTVKTNDSNGVVTKAAKSRTLAGEKLWKLQFNQVAEGLMFAVQSTATAAQVEYMLLDGENFGEEDSGL